MKHYSEFKKDLAELIAFKSVFNGAEGDAPFGVETKNALRWFLNKAQSFGFETKNYDDYAGEIVFGEGEEIGVIGHLDVVPTGGGWDTDPFTLTLKDGVFYARGVEDDKGPMLLFLYALKELKESGITPKRKIRFFVGCNEETGWQDVEYLKTKTSMPEYGISPDGNFPVSYAEKGVYVITFDLPKLKYFSGLNGGTVINAVCAYACAKAEKEVSSEELNEYGLTLKDGVIESIGVTAHGSHPELGKNALKPLFEYFSAAGEEVKEVIECLFKDCYGVSELASPQGKVTLSPDLLFEDEKGVHIACDCRVPYPLSVKDVRERLDKSGLKYSVSEKHIPVCVEKDGWFVTSLLKAYESVTGEKGEPISMGGSTFARVFEKGCAFGVGFPNEDSCAHSANEFFKEELLLKSFEIYKAFLEEVL